MNTNNDNNKQTGLSWSAPQNTPKPFMPPVKPAVVPVTVKSNTNNNAAKIVGWLAVGVVAGVVIAWGATLLFKHGNQTPVNSAVQNATSTAATNTTSNTTSTLIVPTPQKAGLSVTIENASVSAPTWVVVYESLDGKPGNVLGAAIFSADHSSGTVDLLRGTMAGQTYFVTEQSDNGDRRFSLKDDTLVTVDSQPVWVSFTAN